MNRFHVHLNVSDLDASVRFYTELFAASPTVKKHDYAKWMLDDPRINFAISNAGRAQGIDHLGIQVDSDDALQQLQAFDARKAQVLELHYFGGLTYDEMAAVMQLSPSTIDTELRFAKAWLRDQLA